MCDGVFKSSPGDFKQVFTIHGMIYDKFLPLIYVLLPEKSQECYKQMLQKINGLISDIELSTLICDFELAISSAFNDAYPNIILGRCLFHFGQIIWRNLQKYELSFLYVNDKTFRIDMKKFKDLSSLPMNNIKECFNTKKEELIEDYPVTRTAE